LIRTFFVWAKKSKINVAVQIGFRQAKATPTITQEERLGWLKEMLTGDSEHPGLSRRAPRCRAAPANPGPIRTGSDGPTGYGAAGVRWPPRFDHSPAWRDDQYDGIKYACLPVDNAVFVATLCCNVFQLWAGR
jgi:hypothetical protein